MNTKTFINNNCHQDLGKNYPILTPINGIADRKVITYFEEATDMYDGVTTLKMVDGKLMPCIQVQFELIKINFSAN